MLQLNFSTTATLGTGESGHCREVAVVERLKQERMCRLSAKRGGRSTVFQIIAVIPELVSAIVAVIGK